jgi:hypothetical protein
MRQGVGLRWRRQYGLRSQKKSAKCPFADNERKRTENTVKSRLKAVQLGGPQTSKKIAIKPIIAPAGETSSPSNRCLEMKFF